MRRAWQARGGSACLVLLLGSAASWQAAAQTGAAPKAAPAPIAAPATRPALSAAVEAVAGSMLTVTVSRLPVGETRLAVVRAGDGPDVLIAGALVVGAARTQVPLPGQAGVYELRLLERRETGIVVLARQPLTLQPPIATVAAPALVKPGANFPARGIGPQGPKDVVTLVPMSAPPEARGAYFMPIDNAESTIEAPREPGAYELRYVMDAPLSGLVVLARQPVEVRR